MGGGRGRSLKKVRRPLCESRRKSMVFGLDHGVVHGDGGCWVDSRLMCVGGRRLEGVGEEREEARRAPDVLV